MLRLLDGVRGLLIVEEVSLPLVLRNSCASLSFGLVVAVVSVVESTCK